MSEVSNSTFSSVMVDSINYNQWVLSTFNAYISKSVLELGIGHGEFCTFFKDKIDKYTGVDIDINLLEYAKQKYPNQHYYYGDITDVSFAKQLNDEKFDSFLCFNVLEHIQDDKLAVQNMLSVIKPNGYLLLFVPAFETLFSDLDRLAGHYRRYTKKTIKNLILPNQGKIIRLEYFNSIGGIGWWLNKFTSHGSLESKMVHAQIRFFDKFVLPFSKVLNFATRNFFGQSVLCVVQKNG